MGDMPGQEGPDGIGTLRKRGICGWLTACDRHAVPDLINHRLLAPTWKGGPEIKRSPTHLLLVVVLVRLALSRSRKGCTQSQNAASQKRKSSPEVGSSSFLVNSSSYPLCQRQAYGLFSKANCGSYMFIVPLALEHYATHLFRAVSFNHWLDPSNSLPLKRTTTMPVLTVKPVCGGNLHDPWCWFQISASCEQNVAK